MTSETFYHTIHPMNTTSKAMNSTPTNSKMLPAPPYTTDNFVQKLQVSQAYINIACIDNVNSHAQAKS